MALELHNLADAMRSLLPTTEGRARHAMRLAWISSIAAPSPGFRHEPSALSIESTRERLFDSLEGQVLRVFQRAWTIRVYSISEQDGWRWLQLSLEGDCEYTVTMRVSLTDSGDHALRRLSGWLANPSKTHDIFCVA